MRGRDAGQERDTAERVIARRRQMLRRRIVGTVAVVLASVLLIGCVGGGIVLSRLRADLPDPNAAAGAGRDQTSVILDRNGETIYKVFAEQNRTDRPLAEMPLDLKEAVIAVEDKRYYEHSGVDPIGIARALYVDVFLGKSQGGSTITQQYVKQAFIGDEMSLKRKVSEALLAYEVESKYSKDEVLELYLNTIYFGHGAYGVEAASQTFFGKSVSDLTLAESALLAGDIKSPGRFSPYLDLEASKGRRNLILGMMKEQGYIDEAEHAAATAEEIVLVGLKKNTSRAPYFTDYVMSAVARTVGDELLQRGGLTVQTTLDLRANDAAVSAINEVLNEPDDPSAALLSLEVGTGRIIAMVGGRDYATQQFNAATQGLGRQAGSSFKPFVLTAAFEQGISPEASFESGAVQIPVGSGTWSVNGRSAGGPLRLRPATEQSINSPFAQLIMQVGPENVTDAIKRLGIERDITPIPAIALGGLEEGVTPLDMATAFSTFSNKGVHVSAYGIESITTPDGEILWAHEPASSQAITEQIAWMITDFLKGVATRGTGANGKFGLTFAAKTGTTQQYRDAWYVGYTPHVSTAVWMGYAEGQREMIGVHGIRVTGGSLPSQIFSKFMKVATEGMASEDWSRPSGIRDVEVCRETGDEPTEFCPETITGRVFTTTQLKPCELHAEPTEMELPDVTGLTESLALSRLADVGFTTVNVVEKQVNGVAAGVVASQQPNPGMVLTPDTPIEITVSTGSPRGQQPPPPPEPSTPSTDTGSPGGGEGRGEGD